ncbi:hypothetical protein ACIPWF_19135 [Paenarthrobacter sp. NPDC089989]|uniref:hypothetical protein n=1 Tax=unclassified Paenarthrobacter TaxID=2634190 RepID=UPI0037F330B8
MSNAANLGYRALADIAEAAAGLDHDQYRIVGGHMVQLLLHVYPTDAAMQRSTADADAGIQRATAAGQALHDRLLVQGYEQAKGNHYIRRHADQQTEIDLLVPRSGTGKTEILNGRRFDAIPGLGFALSSTSYLTVEATVQLFQGGSLRFTVPVPDVEAALILKALAWKSRKADKDLADISTLMEIVHEHKDALNKWGYSEDRLAATGSRKDAAAALHEIVAQAEARRIRAFKGLQSAAKLSLLIRKHIPVPAKR